MGSAVSLGSRRHLPWGKDMLEGPKSVRSNMTTRSVWRSCMCMAEMPTFDRSKSHLAAACGGRSSSRGRKERIRGGVMFGVVVVVRFEP